MAPAIIMRGEQMNRGCRSIGTRGPARVSDEFFLGETATDYRCYEDAVTES